MQFVGPIVGEVTDTSARVVVQPDRPGLVTVTLSGDGVPVVSASSEATAEEPVVGLLLQGLTAGTKYDLAVSLDGTKVPERTGRLTTRVPGAETLVVAAVSCNFTVREGGSSRWQNLLETQVRPGKVSAVLHIGDQVYLDTAFGQSIHDAKSRGRTDDVRRAIAARFRRVYEYAWNYAPTREVLATTSNLMIWDDHEVRNGWGSHPNDRNKESTRYWVGTIARRVFQDFQRQLWAPRDESTKHEAHAHVYGQTGIIFLDQRGGRTFSFDQALPYLGSAQWAWLRETLGSASFAPVRALLVVTSVPLLYVGPKAAQIGGFVASDLRDQWSHPDHLKEQKDLIELLLKWKAANLGRAVTVLGGDVHVGSHALLKMRTTGEEFVSVLEQYITSPITNEPPGPLAFYGLKLLLDRDHEIGDQFRYRHEDLTRKRNYAVLNLETPSQGATITGSILQDAND